MENKSNVIISLIVIILISFLSLVYFFVSLPQKKEIEELNQYENLKMMIMAK